MTNHVIAFKKFKIPTENIILIILQLVSLTIPYLFPIFVPGILYVRKFLEKHSPIPSIVYGLASSIATWIILYWLISLLPISLAQLIVITFTFCIIGSLVSVFSPIKPINYRDLAPLIPISVIAFIFMKPTTFQITPSGADMSAHTYIATHILKTSGFPNNYEPMLPADNFGSSPIGMPLIIAINSFIYAIPTFQSAVIVSCSVYIFFALSVYAILALFFRPSITLITLFLCLFLNLDILQYIGWGGNPTLASLAIIYVAASIWIEMYQKKYHLNAFYVIIIGILIFASFATHQIPVSLLVFSTPLIIAYLNQKESRKYLVYFIKICLVAAMCTLPFFLRVELPNTTTNQSIKEWQQNQQHSWTGNMYNAIVTIPQYIQQRIGQEMGMVVLIGVVITTFQSIQRGGFIYGVLLLLIIGILNSKYWFLPLSQLFYPDRLVTLFTPVYGLAIGSVLIAVQATYVSILNSPSQIKRAATTLIAIIITIFYIRHLFNAVDKNIKYFFTTAESQVIVTNNDLQAILWIAKNTSQQDIIQNNYGDAGIWIPAIAYRKIILFHTIPFEYNDIETWLASNPVPSYTFIGEKIADGTTNYQTTQDFEGNPDYQLMYQSGESRVYKHLRVAPD